MGSAFAPLDGSGNQQIWLNFYYVSYSQAGNYSTWYYEVRYYGNGWGSWGFTCSWSLSGFAVGGGSVYIGQANAFDTYTVLGAGYFTKAHNSAGALNAGTLVAGISANHGSVGSGSVGVYSGAPPVIPTAPPAPIPYPNLADSVDQITTESMRYRFQDNGTGGAAVTSRAVQYSTTEDFSSGNSAVTGVSSAGTLTATDLEPGTTYYWRARIQTAAGVSPWSIVSSGTTLAGIYVSDGSDWKPTALRVSDGTAWENVNPLISDGDSWEEPIDV